MEIFRKIWSYLTFRKDQEFAENRYIKSMHRINKISIYLFLFAILLLAYRLFIRS